MTVTRADIAAAMAEHNRAQERDGILREQFNEDIPMNYTTPEPLRSRVFTEHAVGPSNPSAEVTRQLKLADTRRTGFPRLAFLVAVLLLILITIGVAQ